MRTKGSLVWRFFEEVDKDSAVCKLCYKQYSRKGRGTGSLRSHLKSMHQSEYLTLRTDESRIIELQKQEAEGLVEQNNFSEDDHNSSFCFVAAEGKPTQVKVEYSEENSHEEDYSEPDSEISPSQSKKQKNERSSYTDNNHIAESMPDTSQRITTESFPRQKKVSGRAIESGGAVDAFFSSMALTVKQLPPALAAKCKAEICNVVTKWELLALEQDKATPSQSDD